MNVSMIRVEKLLIYCSPVYISDNILNNAQSETVMLIYI